MKKIHIAASVSLSAFLGIIVFALSMVNEGMLVGWSLLVVIALACFFIGAGYFMTRNGRVPAQARVHAREIKYYRRERQID